MTPIPQKAASPKDKRYWLRLFTVFLVACTFALIFLPTFLGASFTWGLLYGPCGYSGRTPANVDLPFEPVTIASQNGGSFSGFFIPGSNGATIIMPPTLHGNSASRLPQAAMLAQHGYAVLLFESRRCAGIGPVSLGYHEVDEVEDALNYLLSRPNVDPKRIGVHGFSSAGATSVMAGARLPQLQAVVAEGGYGNFFEETIGNYNDYLQDGRQSNLFATIFLTPFRWAMQLTYRLAIGSSIYQLNPTGVIHQIDPRPVLLIYGSKEPSLTGGQNQLAAAGPNTQLWIVDGAGHGTYLATAPEEYETHIVEFFDQALLK